MIRAIILDVGGTYLKGSFVDFVNKSNKILGISEDFYTNKEIVFDEKLNKGEICIRDCFRNFFGVHISDENMELMIDAWKSTWTLDNEMKAIIKKLKMNYKLAILSNSDKINSNEYAIKGW